MELLSIWEHLYYILMGLYTYYLNENETLILNYVKCTNCQMTPKGYFDGGSGWREAYVWKNQRLQTCDKLGQSLITA